jgi:ComF family protein
MARIMATVLEPYTGEDVLLCPIPTAPSRMRQRGFDHAKLLSGQLSKLLKIKSEFLLRRCTNTRQVGASRSVRMKQTEEAYEITQETKIKGRNIVLVDDVMTTGATISATAKMLKQAGAKSVSAVIFAQKV